ncbi:MAG: right-handed parallel beta-helix repeat-containing protein [Methanobrevibacter sp.]|nr:right-handed parallel beta-helix repeat-containing protein [Methanobrevibacter sp.]
MINKSSLKNIMVIFILFLTTCFLISSVSGAKITVNNADGIQGAITKSNNGDTIELNPGKYTGSKNIALTISKKVTISGKGPAKSVIIDAQKMDRIFTITGNADVVFRNITFTNGNMHAATSYGNIFINSGSRATFINCIFTNNSAMIGAAIYNKGYCRVVNSTFTKNTGALDGSINNVDGGNLVVSNSIFTNNHITAYGGVITNFRSHSQVTGSSFTKTSGNVSSGFAGFYNDAGTATLKNSILKNNKYAGIINTGSITVGDNTLSGNPYGNFLSNGTVKDESRLKTYLTLAKPQVKYGKKATFKATLKNHLKKAMKSRSISFYVNDKYFGKAKTNSKGIATLTKKVTKKGKLNFTAKYSGTKTFKNSSYTRKVTVK